jgi:hypothetical protein
MAGTYCLAILAGFCFHSASVDAQLQDIGLGYALTVKTPSYEASTGQTDVIRSYDWRQQPIACADKNCVRYHKSCSATGVVCYYQIAFVGDASGGMIHISTANAADMATAQQEISLWFGSDTAMLALSSLTQEASASDLAACPADTGPESCNPRTR